MIKGIICHGAWLMSPISELVRGRKMVVHNNLLGDAKNMGIDYVDEDVVVDGDLVSARTGGEHVSFAQRIITLINCGVMLSSLNKKIDMLETRIKELEKKECIAEGQSHKKNIGGHSMAKVLIIATNYGSWAEELQAPWDACKKAGFEVTLATPQG
ncbi:MAG: DJ-1/PfpI family protein, partial [Selenomonadaceae bacterium]|nr:DJ-1/PfpI family protein [Selenomonadaceae bacterium]